MKKILKLVLVSIGLYISILASGKCNYTSLFLVLFLVYAFFDSLKIQYYDMCKHIKTYLKPMAIGCLLILIYTYFYKTVLFEVVGTTSNQALVNNALQKMQLYQSIVAFGIIDPIKEELIFKQLLVKEVSSKNDVKWYALGSTLVFAALHGVNLIGFLIYLPSSVCLMYVYLKTNTNVLCSIVVHCIVNIVMIVL